MRLRDHESIDEENSGSAGSLQKEEEKVPKRKRSTSRFLKKTVSQEVMPKTGLKGI